VTSTDVRRVPFSPDEGLPHQDIGYWAMVLFCLTEGTLFAFLLSSYFFLGASSTAGGWPPAGIAKPELEKPLIMTAVLVSSSMVLFFAERSRANGGRAKYLVGTGVTIALGLSFLGLQAAEYRKLLEHLSPRTSAYASIFYTITGFHGTHVAFGLLLLAWTLVADARGRLSGVSPVAVKNSALYWHFVDGVWLVVLTCLYLSPRWY
jgi:cytochrome c oxidase subunit III